MKGSVRNVELFLLVIFLIITIPLVYSLYNFQNQLAIDLGISHAVIAEHTDVTILKLIGFFITEIFIGCAGIFLIFRELKKVGTNDFSEMLDEAIYSENRKQEDKVTASEKNTHKVSEQGIINDINNISKNTTLKEYCNQSISIIAKHFEISQGIFYLATTHNSKNILSLIGGYAYYKPADGETTFLFGEGLAGQVAKAQKLINIKNVPDGYIKIISGLGEATPSNLLIVPLIDKDKTIAVMELASFNVFINKDEELIAKLANLLVKNLVVKMKISTNDQSSKEV